jgi:type I restriction enzyme, S subunit
MSITKNLSGCQVFDVSNIPSDWDCDTLGARIGLAYGRALPNDDREPGMVGVYGSNGEVGKHANPLVPHEGIVVGRKGTVGAVHFAPGPFWPIDTAYYVLPRDRDNLRYLYHLLRYLPLTLLNAATGVPGLSRRDAYALRGAFAPPVEQEAIARALDASETAISAAVAAVEQAALLKRALAQRLLATGLHGEARQKTAIGSLPLSWQALPVSSVTSSFQYGLSVAMNGRGTLPILRMGNIQDGNVRLTDLKYVTLPAELTAPYMLHRGDVLFNRTNSQEWVGKVGIYRDDMPAVFASYLIRVVPDPSLVDPYFLGHVLSSYAVQCRVKRYATPGVEQVNINATNLGKVLIPVPLGPNGLKEQREIAAIFEAVEAIARGYRTVIAAHEALGRALSEELLTGRVRALDEAVSK